MLQSPLHVILLALLALAGLTSAKKTGSVLTTNEKQAAALQAAAVRLKPGHYVFQNVKTKQKLLYTAKGNHIYPSKKGTTAAITIHQDKGVAWHRIGFGPKNKCLSSAWGGSGNNAAVMYVCASGSNSKKTTLEKTKQWWLFVPTSKPTAAANSNSYANRVLLAAQADSVKTREKKIAAQKNAFHGRMARRVRKRALKKRGIKTVSGGTFYIFPTDHLLDRASALTGGRITTRGIKNTQLKNWKKGDKAQQWKVTRVK
ncbi:hypothetical protein JCM10908_006814 [Rhodotorula pacifica]|uniref:uncharacterized protein n=1 Tax=Rhodotorula pacifica TaxID=1495444 RepID=UPI00317264B5